MSVWTDDERNALVLIDNLQMDLTEWIDGILDVLETSLQKLDFIPEQIFDDLFEIGQHVMVPVNMVREINTRNDDADIVQDEY